MKSERKSYKKTYSKTASKTSGKRRGITLPALGDTVAIYKSGTNIDGTFLLDSHPGIGDYQAEPAIYAQFDATMYCDIEEDLVLTGDFKLTVELSEPSLGFCLIANSSTDSAPGGRISLSSSTGVIFSRLGGVAATFSDPITTGFTLERVGTSLIVVHNGTTQSRTTSSDPVTFNRIGRYFSIRGTSKACNLKIEDSSGVIFSNFLAQDSAEDLCVSQVGPDVIWKEWTDSPYAEGIDFGHVWENYSEVENLLTSSENFDIPTTAWYSAAIADILIESEAALAPDGSMSAWEFTRLNPTSTNMQQVYNVADTGDWYFITTWVKAGTQNDFRTRWISYSGGTTQDKQDTISLITGEFEKGIVHGYTDVVDLGDGWWKIVVGNQQNGTGNTVVRVDIAPPPLATGSFLLWKTQLTYLSVKEYAETTDYPVVGKVPKDLDNPTQDVFGNTLTNTGEGRQDMPVAGYTGTWDAIAYADSSALTVNDFDFEARINPTGSSSSAFIGGSASSTLTLRVNATNHIEVVQVGVAIRATSNETLTDGEWSTVRCIGDNTGVEIYIDGVLDSSTSFTASFTVGSAVRLGSDGAGFRFTGSISWIKQRVASVLVNHWVVESHPTSLQETIYDTVGGNHATLINATLPFFTTEKEGSRLLAGGYSLSENLLAKTNIANWDLANATVVGDEDEVFIEFAGVNGRATITTSHDHTTVATIFSVELKGNGTVWIEAGSTTMEVTVSNEWARYSLILPLGIPTTPARIIKRSANDVDSVYAKHPMINTGSTIGVYTPTVGSVILEDYVPARSDGLNALGQPLTNAAGKVWDVNGDHAPILLYAPETLDFYNLAVLCGIEEDLYSGGEAIGLTPLGWTLLVPTGNLANALFLSMVKSILIGYNPALEGTDITKLEKYLGI